MTTEETHRNGLKQAICNTQDACGEVNRIYQETRDIVIRSEARLLCQDLDTASERLQRLLKTAEMRDT
jgi:hypothetical protein